MASSSMPLMLTYPGFDTPDGRTKGYPTVDEALRLLRGGESIRIAPGVFPAHPVAAPPGMGQIPGMASNECRDLVIWEPDPVEVMLEREKQRQEQERFRVGLLSLWTALQEMQRQLELEAKRKVEEELRRQREEEERRRRFEEMEAARKKLEAEEAARKKALEAEVQKALQSFETFKTSSKLAASSADFGNSIDGAKTRLENFCKTSAPKEVEERLKKIPQMLQVLTDFEKRYVSAVETLEKCQYAKAKLLADIGTTALALATNDGPAKLKAFERAVKTEIENYEKQLLLWKPALDTTKERIKYLPAPQQPSKTSALEAIEKLAAQDPFKKEHSEQLVEFNRTLDTAVARSFKIKKKDDETKRVITEFVAKEGVGHLARRTYRDLPMRYKHLIKAIRSGTGVNSVTGIEGGITYCWDASVHQYRGSTAPNLKRNQNAREYRLYLSSSGHSTRKSVGPTSCGLTGERLTSVGTADTMIFFHCDHPEGSNGYYYGIIINLPLDRTRSTPYVPGAARPVKGLDFPVDYPAAPAAVI